MKIRIWILFVVVAVFSLPAFAQRYYYEDVISPDTQGASYDLDRYMDNPCTATYDPVWVDYNVYLEQAYSDANDRFRFDEMTSVGGTYKAAGSTTSDVGYTQPFTLRKYHKVNTSDNFHVVTVINFYPASRYTDVTVETACGDGSPDSKE